MNQSMMARAEPCHGERQRGVVVVPLRALAIAKQARLGLDLTGLQRTADGIARPALRRINERNTCLARNLCLARLGCAIRLPLTLRALRVRAPVTHLLAVALGVRGPTIAHNARSIVPLRAVLAVPESLALEGLSAAPTARLAP